MESTKTIESISACWSASSSPLLQLHCPGAALWGVNKDWSQKDKDEDKDQSQKKDKDFTYNLQGVTSHSH